MSVVRVFGTKSGLAQESLAPLIGLMLSFPAYNKFVERPKDYFRLASFDAFFEIYIYSFVSDKGHHTFNINKFLAKLIHKLFPTLNTPLLLYLHAKR